jgi:hypothetical protein
MTAISSNCKRCCKLRASPRIFASCDCAEILAIHHRDMLKTWGKQTTAKWGWAEGRGEVWEIKFNVQLLQLYTFVHVEGDVCAIIRSALVCLPNRKQIDSIEEKV